jgi:xylulokinase
MNLWDIKTKAWNEQLLSLAAGTNGLSELKSKLGLVSEDGGKSFGQISSYFVSKYGFSSTCEITPFTGDNLSTILALPLRASDAIVSLGTSTTFLMSTPQYKPHPDYHFMNHPTAPDLFMFMLCYKNGGLARELVRNVINNNKSESWDKFNHAAADLPPLSQENDQDSMKLGLYFPLPEIVPHVRAGTWRYLYSSKQLSEAKAGEWKGPELDCRAILESQFLSLRLRSQSLVSTQSNPRNKSKTLPPQPRRIYLVGGGSQNSVIADVCSQVLGGAEGIYRLDVGSNACALGAAYKTVWGCERAEGETFEDFISKRWDETNFVEKIGDGYQEGIWEKYGEAMKGFETIEKLVSGA